MDAVGPRFRTGVRQALVLVALATLLGALVHEMRPNRLPWRGAPPRDPAIAKSPEGLREIALEEAWALHRQGLALFLDARDPGAFAEGHLPGALNIPPGMAASYAEEVRALTETGLEPIAYCHGAQCPLSAELAKALQENGVPAVRVLVDGWGAWRRAGHPTDKGRTR